LKNRDTLYINLHNLEQICRIFYIYFHPYLFLLSIHHLNSYFQYLPYKKPKQNKNKKQNKKKSIQETNTKLNKKTNTKLDKKEDGLSKDDEESLNSWILNQYAYEVIEETESEGEGEENNEDELESKE
jgi:hypothetical protein